MKVPRTNHIYWIDDERDPVNYFTEDDSRHIIWLRSAQAFKRTLDSLGLPDAVYFDHDLGMFSESGYECAKYLVKFCEEYDCDLPEYHCQSSNPPGRENILSYLNSYQKSREI